MLIVIGIMLMLVAAAASLMPSSTDTRRVREAARAVNIYLSSARNHAMETGRPCGVTFHCFGNVPCAMNIDQCEVPPCYCGQADTSMAVVQANQAVLDTVPPTGMVTINSDVIQFNCQGPMYTISGMNGGTLTLTAADPNQNPLTPWATMASPPMPYRIFRSPMKGGATPLQLPAGSVIDFQSSGMGGGCLCAGWNAATAYGGERSSATTG